MAVQNGKMRRGWIVDLYDGTQLWECDTDWHDVPKGQIKALTLLFEGRKWTLENKQAYIQRKRASIAPGEKNASIEQRIIGYYEANLKVEYVVDERTGNMIMRVVE